MRRPLTAALLSSALLMLAGAAVASADTRDSANWSGYSIHRSGVTFKSVSAAWVEPSATCTPGRRSFSAFWVGIGGYNLNSTALEQTGTEVDCSASGAVHSTAWYELVPAGSRAIHMPVRPGDRVQARVTVLGHEVTIVLRDATSGRTFSRTIHAHHIDVTSADWIAEAPSVCTNFYSCQTLPLADFGTASFTSAQARSTSGHVGSISDRAWNSTRLRLLPDGRRFIVAQSDGTPAGEATASSLSDRGSQFSVTYSDANGSGGQYMRARAASLRAGYLVH